MSPQPGLGPAIASEHEDDPWGILDAHLPAPIRAVLEESLWRPIEAQGTLEAMCADPAFFEDPGRHPAMFADHGIVHVRDVAAGLVRFAGIANGVLLPAREPEALARVQAWGVALAYLHDVGMVDMTAVGRRTHAVYAAHLAFGPRVDVLVGHLLSHGPVRTSLEAAEAAESFGVGLDTVVREALSLAVAHSKSTVPMAALADPGILAALMGRIVFTPMADHRSAATLGEALQRPGAGDSGVGHPSPRLAYAWLAAKSGPKAQLAADLIDAVRALRVADVLRQRGTTLRTSGGFEIFFDARTGRALCTLRSADGRFAYVVTYDAPRSAGEANIRMARVTSAGDLRIAFHRGSFADRAAAGRAADCVTDAILDIWNDVIPTFPRMPTHGLPAPQRTSEDIGVLIEGPSDDPGFAELVRERLVSARRSESHRINLVSDLQGAAAAERERYEWAIPVDPWGVLADRVSSRVSEHGSALAGTVRETTFAEVRRASIAAGEVLLERGSFPAFVYVPLGHGLQVQPTGGYALSPVPPWVAVGATGALRRSERNADIVAAHEVEVLMVPSDRYVAEWLRPLETHELKGRLAVDSPSAGPPCRASARLAAARPG